MKIENCLAISVRRITHSYGSIFDKSRSTPIIDNLSLQLPQGSIYGLLGPSGCGKTTLIRCLLGILPIKSGELTVFGSKPGSAKSTIPGPGVGYMPQDITLYNDLTILETLWYYASLYGLESGQIKDRSNFLLNLLNLPNRNKFVGQLSGGQKRRVSLATALIHTPPLLILDEPTVGVDPLLRKSIWQHLIKLSEQNRLTVLITTHYIEEARSANYVGLMRNGRILEQDNPEVLLRRYQMNTLEQVFLHLCSADDSNSSIKQAIPLLEHSKGLSEISSDSSSGISADIANEPNTNPVINQRKPRALNQIATILRKNLQSLRRSSGYLLFQVFLPMLEAILFCLCLGLDLHSIPVAVYNGDSQQNLSAHFLRELNPTIIQQSHYSSLQDAIESVRKGQQSTAILIHPNFTHSFLARLTGSIANEALHNSSIYLAPDMSNQLMVQFVQKECLRAFSQVIGQFVNSSGLNPALVESPIQVDTPIYGSADPPFTEFMVSGTILSISFFAALSLTTMNLVVEKTHGLIERTVIVGVSHFQILFAHLLTYTLVILIQVALLLVMMFAVFKIPFNGSLVWIGLLTIGQAICGMCFGLFISSVSESENMATMLSLGTFFPNFLLSGAFWPLEAMSDYLRYFSYAMPATIPTLSMRILIIRGWNVAHWEVASGFVVTLGWILGFLLISTLVIKYVK